MKAKSYLNLTPSCPKWAFVADSLIRKSIPISLGSLDHLALTNTFLQSWSPTTRADRSSLPPSLRTMLKTAATFHVSFSPPTLEPLLMRQLPIWYHIGADPSRKTSNKDQWAHCQQSHHNINTVGDMELYTLPSPP